MKIVIIEDEKLTAKDLEKTICAVDPKAEVIAVLYSVEEAILFFSETETFDLIFSDIHLGDGLSFEIFEQINVRVPIIYCTAFNQYALDAFKTLGIEYILKPFSSKTVEEALQKYKSIKDAFRQPLDDYSHLISRLKNELSPKSKSVIIQQGDKIIPISLDFIALFFIQHENVYAYTFKGEKRSLSQNLNKLEKDYVDEFFRVNRQFLVNRKAVKDASHYFNRKVMVNLNIPFDEQIVVGKLKVTDFLNWLEKF